MAKLFFPSSLSCLTGAVAISLFLFCTACGCISIPDSGDAAYQPPTFEPTVCPTNIPSSQPTIVCEPPGNQTTVTKPGTDPAV